MKKTINKKAILDVCQTLGKYVSNNPIIPILACFQIKDNEITVDNQEVRITAQVPKENDLHPLADVSVCVPARQLITALNNMDSNTVTLKFDAGKITVSDPVNKKGVTINTFDGSEFPDPQVVKGNSLFLPIPAIHFLPALEKAASFADGSAASKFANVGLSVYDEVLYINGGTGRDMYEAQIDIPGVKQFSAMITVKGATALCEIDDIEEVTIERRGNFIFCGNGSIAIQARCMEGVYPDTRALTVVNKGTFTLLPRKSAIGASNVCGMIKNDVPLILIEKSEAGVTFTSFNDSQEIAKQLVPAIVDEQPEGKWYNNSLFKKCLNAIPTDNVRLDNKERILFISPDENPIGVKEFTFLAEVAKG
jgi:DNA polymerase III sliding clamp (beta) subunit (PCNA family)